jgi:hypothetical protein
MKSLKNRLHAIWFDGLLGSFCTGQIDSVWSGCAPQCPHMAVYSKLVRRRFFR